MSEKISRRDFLKLAGAGAAITAVLTGCGPSSRYVVREPYTKMPEYTNIGKSTYFASFCRECAAGCGIVVRTFQGRALKIEGSASHPVNLGKTCARGQAAVQGLYNPDRIQKPGKQASRGSGKFSDVSWDDAFNVVTQALRGDPGGIYFLMGLAPDHLFDLVSDLAKALGAPAPLRYGALAMFDARATLSKASEDVFGTVGLPFFDLGSADVAFSFGANFLETWVSPVAYTRGYSNLRKAKPGRRGYFVQFEPRMSQTAMNADEWIPVVPGTEGQVALALGRLVAEARGGSIPAAFTGVDVKTVAQASDVSEDDLTRLANIFSGGEHPIAIPGGLAMGQTNGLDTAKAVLALNASVNNIGLAGGLFMTPSTGVYEDSYHRPANIQEMGDFVNALKSDKVKTLFIHGVNPVFELPAKMDFRDALKSVPLVISFASFPDETAMEADYVFPDHTPLEAWGYQRVWNGTDRATLSGAQPVVVPFYDTRATADVLLAAVQAAGGVAATALPYKDEVEFMQNALLKLVQADGIYSAPEIKTFMAYFQQHGGWWQAQAGLNTMETSVLQNALSVDAPEYVGNGDFYLIPFPSPILGDGSGANRPWLQETPDPSTTVTWNSWVEINPKTAKELGLENDDVVLITSPAGAIEASVYQYPAIRPDTVAIPFGQGHTALGRYAEGRGVNPATLFSLKFNQAGDLAFAATKVKIEKTGRQRPLARLESSMGVYGDGLK
jgi:anaerobic selenocysteine-containing dehydrogenase